MTFVGIDLAWAAKNPTGIAVLDDAGTLVFLGSAKTDDDIVGALQPWSDVDDLVVAFDAPIVVRNDTGTRPAERDLNLDFGPFQAGAHPSNTGKPEFADGQTRAARLTTRLNLGIAPIAALTRPTVEPSPHRLAVEVYPHPATVALFRLGRTIKYKQKPGRSLTDLRDGLLRLVKHLETLRTVEPALRLRHNPSWAETVARIRMAETKSALKPAEDEVDAVVCAYVALLGRKRPDRLTAYGSDRDGYILTPTLPPDLKPEGPPIAPARSPTLDLPEPTAAPTRPTELVTTPRATAPSGVGEYAARHPTLIEVTRAFADLVIARLDDAGINYLSVTSRTKSVESFAAKARQTRGGELVYGDPLTEITDQVGLRIITYLHEDVEAVADQVADQFVVLDDRDLGQETASQGAFGYASRHLLVTVDPNDPSPAIPRILRGQRASIQIRTVLQHAWAEFEHDIRYKGTIPTQYAADMDRRFTLAAALLELADREFSGIRERLQQTMGDTAAPPAGPVAEVAQAIGPADLAALLAERFTDAGWSRADHYEWMSGLLDELGIASPATLLGIVDGVDTAAVDAQMGYRHPPGAVRRLDDALLDRYGERYIELGGNAHRAEALRSRLHRLRGDEPTG